MISYVTVGTNDLPRAATFYDALAAEMGTGRMMDFDTFIAWGTPGGAAGIAATKPRFMRLTARFNVRGGIFTHVVVEHRKRGWQPPPAVDIGAFPAASPTGSR